MIQDKLKLIENTLNDQDYQLLAEMTDGFSGADLDTLCTDVAMQSLILASKTNKFK